MGAPGVGGPMEVRAVSTWPGRRPLRTVVEEELPLTFLVVESREERDATDSSGVRACPSRARATEIGMIGRRNRVEEHHGNGLPVEPRSRDLPPRT